ncbi:MAG TPA: twin-arginine translocase subunit TatC [Pirellulales bacterium]|nr:twin-arginine translocase subunit TatC [Pirellulales bacterium]
MATNISPQPAADNFGGDPFQHTTMSFGEHLDELRVSLFKAVLSLGIGFCIGMLFGTSIVNFIQGPLVKALVEHRETESLERFREELRTRAEHNDETAQRLLDDPALADLVTSGGMLPDPIYIDPREILAELKKQFPEAFDKVELPAPKPATAASERAGGEPSAAKEPVLRKSDLLPIHVWRSVLDDERNQLISTGAPETFMIWLKASFLGGAIISSPFVFYFLWSFVAAGLYAHEKRYIHFFLPFSIGLFLLGASTAFFFVFKPVLNFFFSYNRAFHINTELRISEWLSFVLLLPLGFGISFQLPLVMLFLERIGIFTVESYLAKWRIAVIVLAILSMILSPGGDPNSMLLMLVPLVGLYFAGIGLCKWLPARRGASA